MSPSISGPAEALRGPSNSRSNLITPDKHANNRISAWKSARSRRRPAHVWATQCRECGTEGDAQYEDHDRRTEWILYWATTQRTS
jgi:hypothetical protein